MVTSQDDHSEDEWAAPTPIGAHGVNEQDGSDDTHEIHPAHPAGYNLPQQRFDDNRTPQPRHDVHFTDRQRMPPPPQPTLIRTLSIRSENMRKDSLSQRAEADQAIKDHQAVRGNLEDAIESRNAATAKLKAVERQVMRKRMNSSLLERKLSEQICDICGASDVTNIYTVLYDAILIKIDDLENDQEALHEVELDLAENLKVVSQMEVTTSRVRLAELRSKLYSRRANLQLVEREAQIGAVESALEDWVSVKTWASRQSSVECTKLEHLEINIDPSCEGQGPPTKRRRQTSANDTMRMEGPDECQASPERGTLKRRFSRILTDLPGYLGVFGANHP